MRSVEYSKNQSRNSKLAKATETAAQLADETKKRIFTPLELDLNRAASAKSAVGELVKRCRPIDFLLLNAGLVPTKQRVCVSACNWGPPDPVIGA